MKPGAEPGWRWCHKCSGLFWGRDRALFYAFADSQCPAPGGGVHDGSLGGDYVLADPVLSGNYTLIFNNSDTVRPYGSLDWRCCQNCLGMYRDPGKVGVCPSGGTHRPATVAVKQYEVLRGVPTASGFD